MAPMRGTDVCKGSDDDDDSWSESLDKSEKSLDGIPHSDQQSTDSRRPIARGNPDDIPKFFSVQKPVSSIAIVNACPTILNCCVHAGGVLGIY